MATAGRLKVDLPLGAGIPLIPLVVAGDVVHVVVVADFRDQVDARGEGDDGLGVNDPGIIFLGEARSAFGVVRCGGRRRLRTSGCR